MNKQRHGTTTRPLLSLCGNKISEFRDRPRETRALPVLSKRDILSRVINHFPYDSYARGRG